MEPAAAVTIFVAVLIILALVVYLVAVIFELRKIAGGLDAVIAAVGGIVSKSEPVNGVVKGEVKNIDEVYTRGAVQLLRLGRESPLGAGAMSGAALRDPTYSSTAARSLYQNPSGPTADEPGGARHQPRSPTIGVDAPEVFPPED